MTLLRLFWSFFQIGLFSFGGGYAALPLIQHQVVEQSGWLTISQFTAIITISQMTPGPIALNSATFVGIQIAGFPGALIATLGCILPSCIVALTLAWFYYKYRNLSLVKGVLQGLRPAVVALIASSGLSILLRALLAGNRLLSSLPPPCSSCAGGSPTPSGSWRVAARRGLWSIPWYKIKYIGGAPLLRCIFSPAVRSPGAPYSLPRYQRDPPVKRRTPAPSRARWCESGA